MKTDELDFDLSPELIAQEPPPDRSASRLLHYRKADRSIAIRTFADLPALLRKGDLLVFNNTKVLPARFDLRKQTGGRIEGLFLDELGNRQWLAMLKNLGNYRGELTFESDPTLSAHCIRAVGEGQYELEVSTDESAELLLARVGRMPLPPYIKRGHSDSRDAIDRERYQTIYAQVAGSVAAPTAGLHFTPSLLAELEAAGIGKTFVTLHVGLGTFKSVAAPNLAEHQMHQESFEIAPEAAEAINVAQSDSRRIVGVGTTAARVLESIAPGEPLRPTRAQTSIFIYPPYQWRRVGALLTNFHLPRSTLIALVAAFVGLDEQRRIYARAIEERFRFFSYGDASFLE
jgi:S-adenosylmethionine:tRNA ribosyltransferase-isomerase